MRYIYGGCCLVFGIKRKKNNYKKEKKLIRNGYKGVMI